MICVLLIVDPSCEGFSFGLICRITWKNDFEGPILKKLFLRVDKKEGEGCFRFRGRLDFTFHEIGMPVNGTSSRTSSRGAACLHDPKGQTMAANDSSPAARTTVCITAELDKQRLVEAEEQF